MCGPVAIPIAMAVVSAVGTAATAIAAKSQAAAQGRAITQEALIRGKQVQAQAGQQEEQASMQARAQRAASIAAASGANINLGSNSFMSSLQTTTMNQANEQGLILENEQNQQQATVAETQSLLNEKATGPTFLGGFVDTALSGADAYMKGKQMSTLGAYKPTPNVSSDGV